LISADALSVTFNSTEGAATADIVFLISPVCLYGLSIRILTIISILENFRPLRK
jgi:hypothetical protein